MITQAKMVTMLLGGREGEVEEGRERRRRESVCVVYMLYACAVVLGRQIKALGVLP